MKLETEKAVKRAIKKILVGLSLWHYMPPASVYGKRGIPDFVCCVRGRFVGIEAKSGKAGTKGLSPMQIHVSHSILAAGGEYMVVWDEWSLEYMETRLEKLVKKGNNNVL